ncbi:hypothetical protein JQN58_14245 [Aneurinibacillus sp. BA2021]|nr:hypothetical protein [Aneurinibacillus sp. BA2021]
MKKWLLISLSLLVLLGIGAKFAFDYAADKTMKKVTDEVMKDPAIKKMIEDKDFQAKVEQAANDPDVQAEIAKATGAPKSAASKGESSQKKNEGAGERITFENNSEAARYAMKRFSVSEMNQYRSMISDGLTAEEKKKLKQDVLSRFSPEEIRAFVETSQKSK